MASGLALNLKLTVLVVIICFLDPAPGTILQHLAVHNISGFCFSHQLFLLAKLVRTLISMFS
jgi:hypothetical protein